MAPSLVSLYSGCGGLDLGLACAGFENRLSVESSEDACGSLAANSISPIVLQERIQDVRSQEILDRTRLAPGDLDLLAGGPPCPPFSKSRFYRKEKPRALADPAADTIPQYLRVLGDLRPKAFLLENVPGLAYKVHREALALIEEAAAAQGYSIAHAILNAADYGVPQIRHRLFIVGLRNRDIRFRFPSPTHSGIDDPGLPLLAPWVTAGQVLCDLDTEENASEEGHRAGGRHASLLRDVPPGDNYLYFTKERGHPEPQFKWRSRYWSFLLKLSPDRPSWTIQARRSNNMGPFHWRNRILRLPEVMRLQTFPDDFRFAGKTDSVWRQIGNAVPPLMGTALGRAVIAHLSLLGENAESKTTAVGG